MMRSSDNGTADNGTADQPQPQPGPDRDPGAPSTWEINFNQNLYRSRILNLPDKILLRIIRNCTDRADLYMLRQASFTFWRLYLRDEFKEHHGAAWATRKYYESSATFSDDSGLIRRSKQEAFCGPCMDWKRSANYGFRLRVLTDTAQSPRMENYTMHCLGCRANHMRLRFSIASRLGPRESRRCIAWEAPLRLCAHRSIVMSEMCDWVLEKASDDGVLRLETADVVEMRSCSDCESLAIESIYEDDGNTRQMILPPRINMKTDGEATTLKGPKVFLVEWKLPVFRLRNNDSVTDISVKRHLDRFGQRFGNVLCPHFKFTDGQLLTAFDPSRCLCLGGDTRVDGRPDFDKDRYLQLRRGDHTQVCRDVGRCAEDLKAFLPKVCGQAARHSIECTSCSTSYGWSREGDYIFLERRSQASFKPNRNHVSWSPACYKLVDPESFGVRSDMETKHVLWCDDSSCRNGGKWKELAKQL